MKMWTSLRRLFSGRQLVFALFIMGAFVAGMFVNPFRPVEADTAPREGFTNQVLEVSAAATRANPVTVYEDPDANSPVLDTLLWGDRVLWRGAEQTDAAGNRWIEVAIAEGFQGWMIANLSDLQEGRLLISVAVYTTAGTRVGSSVTITEAGNLANLRELPSVTSTRLRKVQTAETFTVVAGPYQNEYYIWWKLRDAAGVEGWMVDIEGWFTVNP